MALNARDLAGSRVEAGDHPVAKLFDLFPGHRWRIADTLAHPDEVRRRGTGSE